MTSWSTAELISHLRGLIWSRAWREFLAPLIEQRRQDLNKILLDPRIKRQDSANDDFLRGAISALTWVLGLPRQNLTKLEAEEASLLRSESDPLHELDIDEADLHQER